MVKQQIFINIDDSGKLSSKELVSVYGAIIFLSKKEKDKFITQYRSIIKDIHCKYCEELMPNCSNNCPEIKSYNVKNIDRRRIINYLKKYVLASVIVRNKEIYPHIINNKASKGRYLDYVLKLFIKGIIIDLIKQTKIDPHKPMIIILNIDEQSTKSNGYYNLKDGLEEELVHGIVNYNYQKVYEPIWFNDLEIRLTFQKSDKSYSIQASDMLAGLVRRKYLSDLNNKMMYNNLYDYIEYKLFLP